MVGTGKPVSEVCNRFERLPQLLENVPYVNGAPLEQDPVKQAIDQGKARLGGGAGWSSARPAPSPSSA